MLAGYLETRDKLQAKLSETQAALGAAATAEERQRLRDKLRMLRGMLREQLETIARLQPQQPPQRTPTGLVHTDACTWDFFERSDACWSDMQGTTWAQLQALSAQSEGQGSEALRRLMGRARATLTDHQNRRMEDYFGHGLSIHAMAAAEGVNRSTISRCLRRGLEGVERYVFARLFLQECMGADGRFDYVKFARNTSILTDRQLELLYISLSTDESYRRIAERLQLTCSTVSRNLSRAAARLAKVSVGLERATATAVPEAGTEKQIAELLGLPPVFYYRFLRRREPVGALPRYHYELLRLRDAGLSAGQAAERVGASEGTVARYWRRYRGVDISALQAPVDGYHPAERFTAARQFDLRRALADYCAGET